MNILLFCAPHSAYHPYVCVLVWDSWYDTHADDLPIMWRCVWIVRVQSCSADGEFLVRTNASQYLFFSRSVVASVLHENIRVLRIHTIFAPRVYLQKPTLVKIQLSLSLSHSFYHSPSYPISHHIAHLLYAEQQLLNGIPISNPISPISLQCNIGRLAIVCDASDVCALEVNIF